MTDRERADKLLVARGFFDTRNRAQEAIAAGGVTANGAVVRKASESLPRDAVIMAAAAHPYVSRGGVKLAAALAAFGVDPDGRLCLDVGASTGGFTDVLLRAGAARVTAVDSGRDQFHASLRGDPRIELKEMTDIRSLTAEEWATPPDLAVIDVSFISLKLVLPAVAGLLAPVCTIIALVKPQFEAGRKDIGKGGIVRDGAVHARVLEEIAGAFAALGFVTAAPVPSPVTGGDGNTEFLMVARREAA